MGQDGEGGCARVVSVMYISSFWQSRIIIIFHQVKRVIECISFHFISSGETTGKVWGVFLSYSLLLIRLLISNSRFVILCHPSLNVE